MSTVAVQLCDPPISPLGLGSEEKTGHSPFPAQLPATWVAETGLLLAARARWRVFAPPAQKEPWPCSSRGEDVQMWSPRPCLAPGFLQQLCLPHCLVQRGTAQATLPLPFLFLLPLFPLLFPSHPNPGPSLGWWQPQAGSSSPTVPVPTTLARGCRGSHGTAPSLLVPLSLFNMKGIKPAAGGTAATSARPFPTAELFFSRLEVHQGRCGAGGSPGKQRGRGWSRRLLL